jgi:hypothetical protein
LLLLLMGVARLPLHLVQELGCTWVQLLHSC